MLFRSIPPVYTGLRGVPASATTQFFFTNVGTGAGSQTVKEGYGELNVPVLRDQELAKSLELNAAGRITDYRTSGTVETWKFGGTYQPIDDLTFRITRSLDIRAPVLYDLFAGPTSTIGSVFDPHTNVTTALTQRGGGNPTLVPEEGKTFTLGAIMRPRFAPNFTLSVDYWSICISGALATQGAAAMLQACEIGRAHV